MKSFFKTIREHPFLRTFFRFYKSAETDMTSIAVAYYFLISAFPLLLIVANILPYFQIQPDELLAVLKDLLPDSLYSTVAKIVQDVLTKPSTGLLSISILSALWTFSQSIAFLQKAFNKCYGVRQGRGMIWSRIFGFIMSLGLQLLLGLSLALTMFGRMLVGFLYSMWRFDQGLYQQLLTMTEPTVYLMLFLSLVLLYYSLPNVKIPKIRYVLPGAAFVLIVIYSLMNLFSAYIEAYLNRFLDARFVGSVVLIIIMFWFILIAKILIVGAVLNASVQSCCEAGVQAGSTERFSFGEKGKARERK
ncbi:Ribonuclease BN [Streptococcus sp. DD11]|uniref:YihY/virulence factor BrkB family protein n=1 Tax=Streptococcus sp. DD11 TaxID=1777879 RepID=UPI000794095E|nr:YihY/virulence factor BrkB family protein [Streptococcus sp. DD11]KXT84004.1 Ribonuclease BN [Streptococcus sp. DD11]